MKKSILALGVSLAALLLSGVSATAATLTGQGYTGKGYDASSYQCSKGVPVSLDPNFTSFGIIRVTGGRPFTADSCRQALWNAAESELPQEAHLPSLYLNVAYSGAYGKDVTGTCAGVTSASYTGSYLKAYRIGCAEGDYALSKAPIVDSSSSQTANQMWWLDVETANSWSSSDKVLNQATIDGAADRLVQIAPVGIYSKAYYWNAITTGSGWRPASASATWVVSSTTSSSCGSSFNALPQWLLQSGLTATGYDADYACP